VRIPHGRYEGAWYVFPIDFLLARRNWFNSVLEQFSSQNRMVFAFSMTALVDCVRHWPEKAVQMIHAAEFFWAAHRFPNDLTI
jgi:hypothetical protein